MVAIMLNLFSLQVQTYQFTIQPILARLMAPRYRQMIPTYMDTIYHTRILTPTINTGATMKDIDQALTM